MKVTITIEGQRRTLTPFPSYAEAKCACPHCKETPLRVAGKGMRVEGRDTYVCEGFCVACGVFVGTVRAVVSTVFGIEEDDAVLSHGKWRVY